MELVKGGPGWRKGKKGETRKRPTTKMTQEEQVTALTLSRKGSSIGEIADALGRDKSTVTRFLQRLVDTTELGKAIMRAGTAKLAERVIAKADVDQAIEVLSRPGIDVLQAPIKAAPVNNGFGIQLSVGVTSCGTVVRVEGGTDTPAIEAGTGTVRAEEAILVNPARPALTSGA